MSANTASGPPSSALTFANLVVGKRYKIAGDAEIKATVGPRHREFISFLQGEFHELESIQQQGRGGQYTAFFFRTDNDPPGPHIPIDAFNFEAGNKLVFLDEADAMSAPAPQKNMEGGKKRNKRILRNVLKKKKSRKCPSFSRIKRNITRRLKK